MANYLLQKRPNVVGFDTETLDGYVHLLCTPRDFLANTKIEMPLTSEEMLKFIFNTLRRESAIGFFFNINFDFGSILKEGLTDMVLSDPLEVADFAKSKTLIVKRGLSRMGNERFWTVKYVRNKGFSISDGKYTVHCFDISNLKTSEEGKHSLDSLGKEFLGIDKIDSIDRARLGVDIDYWFKNFGDIVRYCKRDAEITEKLAVQTIDSLHEVFGIYPKYYFSSASVAKAYLQKNHPDTKNVFIGKDYNIKTKVTTHYCPLGLTNDEMNRIFSCYNGGIFDVYSLGRNENTSELDLTSAYPYMISNLPKLKNLSIVRGNTYVPSALVGFYEVRFSYREDIPFPFALKTRKVYPTSDESLNHFITKLEYDYLASRGVDMQILWCIHFVGDFEPEFPDFDALYQKRNEYKKAFKTSGDKKYDVLQWSTKIILNSTYGVFAQIKDGISDFTNFIYAAYITAWCRVRIYRLIEEVGHENVVAVMTDALIYRDDGRVIQTGDSLGDLKYEFTKKTTTFFMNGLYTVDDETNSCSCDSGRCERHLKFKKRGFPSLTRAELDAAFGMVLTVKRNKPIRFLSALRSSDVKATVREINVWRDDIRDIDLESNRLKRQVDIPLTFELLRSKSVRTLPIETSLDTPLKVLPFFKEKS